MARKRKPTKIPKIPIPTSIRKPIIRSRGVKVGNAPGSLVFVGEQKVDETVISVIDYSEDSIEEFEVDDLDGLLPFRDTDSRTWINVSGIHDASLVREIGERFGIAELTLEDIMNTTQRARLEEFDDYLYIVIRMLDLDTHGLISIEQVSVVVGPNWVISFQERSGDVFQLVRERIRSGRPRIRSAGTDYLAYALVDAVVDQYFVILEVLGMQIEELEDEVLSGPGDGFEARLYGIKRQIVLMRRSIWPSRELTANLLRSESKLIAQSTQPFLRDVYDHAVQILDIAESFKDVASNIAESYRSVMGNRMNEVMKVLTIIATIFIPLTFIAGIYGMNFQYMPELGFEYGYFVAWGVMLVLGVGLAAYFKKKGWF